MLGHAKTVDAFDSLTPREPGFRSMNARPCAVGARQPPMVCTYGDTQLTVGPERYPVRVATTREFAAWMRVAG